MEECSGSNGVYVHSECGTHCPRSCQKNKCVQCAVACNPRYLCVDRTKEVEDVITVILRINGFLFSM